MFKVQNELLDFSETESVIGNHCSPVLMLLRQSAVFINQKNAIQINEYPLRKRKWLIMNYLF